MSEKKIKEYESLVPGFQLSVKNLPHNIFFNASAPGPNRRGYFQTSDEKIQKIVENHPRFKDGTIRRIPSAEELAEIEKKKEQKEKKETLSGFFKVVGGVPDFSKLEGDQLKTVADLIGVDAQTKDGKPKAKSTLVGEIEEAIGK